jgi:cytochrome P450
MEPTVGAASRDELSRDPYPVYRRLRDEGSCVWLDAANRYVVPRWEDVVALDEVPGITAREEPSLMTRAMGRTMLRTDGEEHARLRAPAQAPLRFRGFAERWGDMLSREAHDLLAPLRDRGHMDVLRDFAGPFAARTLKHLLGLHAARDEDLEFASQAFIDGIGNYADDAGTWRRCERANRLVDAAITADWDRAEDGTVLRALVDAGTLSGAEVRANVKLFISGGLNEPRDVIATTLHALLADPEQLALAREDPDNLAKAAEESLRWTSPIGMFPRVVQEDTELGGVRLAAGTRIGVLIASANRDERHWEDPDRFDLRRATVRHVAFSRGPHVCPGAYVARRQVAGAALPALLALPGLRLATSDVDYRGWVFRGPARLDVTWTTATRGCLPRVRGTRTS